MIKDIITRCLRFRRCGRTKDDSGVGNDGKDDVFVTFDVEIETPSSCHSGLPYVLSLTVFFGLQGRMPKVDKQKAKLLCESLADVHREVGIIFVGSFGEAEPHLPGFFFMGRWVRALSALIAAAALS